MRPSFIMQILNGLTTVIATVLFVMNYKEMDTETIIKMLFLMSIAFGIHALLHHYEEIYYGYNPLTGKLNIRDTKI